MPRPVRIRAVTPLEDYTVCLEFTDNTTKDMDLAPYLHGSIFEPIQCVLPRYLPYYAKLSET